MPGYPAGSLLTASRVVDEAGRTLWEGAPLEIAGARPAVLCAIERVVDDPAERAALAERSSAVAVDMESGRLATAENLVGVIRAISDTPARPVGRLAFAARPDGGVSSRAVLLAFALEPFASMRTAFGARRALASLERAAAALAVASPGG
ncbi:MAG: hypothetical protein M3265_03035 [Actinomycetota bacterium]|nr:hypothetical protein [Actinomycetota bacterium]